MGSTRRALSLLAAMALAVGVVVILVAPEILEAPNALAAPSALVVAIGSGGACHGRPHGPPGRPGRERDRPRALRPLALAGGRRLRAGYRLDRRHGRGGDPRRRVRRRDWPPRALRGPDQRGEDRRVGRSSAAPSSSSPSASWRQPCRPQVPRPCPSRSPHRVGRAAIRGRRGTRESLRFRLPGEAHQAAGFTQPGARSGHGVSLRDARSGRRSGRRHRDQPRDRVGERRPWSAVAKSRSGSDGSGCSDSAPSRRT